MDQVEKLSRTRLRLTKRNKRKLSLPALLNQFHLQREGDSQSSKLEAIPGSPVRHSQSKKSHSTPSSSEKIGRSYSLSSPGELAVLKNYRRLETNNFVEHSPSIDIFKKCTRRLEVTPDVFPPYNADKSADHIVDDTQDGLSKLSSTLLSPIPVCDPRLSYTTPTRSNYLCSTNTKHKEPSIDIPSITFSYISNSSSDQMESSVETVKNLKKKFGSGEVSDCENETENIDDSHDISSQNICPIQTNSDPISNLTKKKEKNLIRRIRRSSPEVLTNDDQNCNSKDEDNFNHITKHKDQECNENHNEAETLSTYCKENSSSKGLMTIMEFLTDPVFNPADPIIETSNRLVIPMDTMQSSGEGYRTPVDFLNDGNQADGLAHRIKGLEGECIQTIGKSKSTISPMLTPKRKGVQKRFPWTSTIDESVSLPDNEKIERNEMCSFSKDGPFRGIRESKKNRRWSSIFPASDEDIKMDLLSQKLDLYSKNGLMNLHISSINHKKYEVPDESLESSWQCLVESPELLSKQRRHQQSTIWELVTTEVTYLNKLKVIVDIFFSCLVNLQRDLLLVEIDTQMLFSNIQDIYATNLVLWHEHIIKMLEFSRSTGQPLDPTFLFDAFSKIEEIMHPYTQYCLEQSICQTYCRDKDFDSIYFKTYLAWCETQRECNRLRLADILVSPMQRLTKYSLLLQAISKKTTEDDYKELLDEMICSVDKFVSKVNNTLRYHHDQKMIFDISTRIEAYEVVESKEEELEKGVKIYSQLNLQQSMPGCSPHHQRSILFHGDMKLRDAQTSKLDVHVFLFTDMLLITKCTQKKAEKLKIIRPPFHVSRLVVIDVKDVTNVGLIYINEWNLAEASFTLQCHSEQLQKAWIQTLQQAQERYKILRNSKDNLDDSYVSDLPMYTRGLEVPNGIQSLTIDSTSLGASPNRDSVCISGLSSIMPSKDLGASPNVDSTDTSGISSLVMSNCGTTDISQYISTNSSDKFAFLHSNDSCKDYSLGATDEIDQILNNRKLDDGEFISSMWIGYSSMPESPENMNSHLDDLEDSDVISGNALRIPVKYSSNGSFLSPNINKCSHSLEDGFPSMTNISSTPKNDYVNADEIISIGDEMQEMAIINVQEKTSEDPLNEHKFCTRINITLGEGQKTDPEFHSESRLWYGPDNFLIYSTPELEHKNKDCVFKSNESPNDSLTLLQQRLLENKSDFTNEGSLKTVINISPMECGRSKTSNISTTYIYQDTNINTNITFGGFSHYITESNKKCMESTKSFQEEYSFTIKMDGSELVPEVLKHYIK